MTLTEFLLARIAEDEAEAREARVMIGTDAPPEGVVRRRIVKEWGWSETLNGDDLMRILALPYADHPDYRQEWRP